MTEKLFATFVVTVKDVDGNVIQKDVVEDTASVAIEDIKQNSLICGADEIGVELVSVEIRDGDDVTHRIERTDDYGVADV